MLPAADQGDDFDLIACFERAFRMAGARNQFAILFHGDELGLEIQMGDEPGHGGTFRDVLRLAIDVDLHERICGLEMRVGLRL